MMATLAQPFSRNTEPDFYAKILRDEYNIPRWLVIRDLSDPDSEFGAVWVKGGIHSRQWIISQLLSKQMYIKICDGVAFSFTGIDFERAGIAFVIEMSSSINYYNPNMGLDTMPNNKKSINILAIATGILGFIFGAALIYLLLELK